MPFGFSFSFEGTRELKAKLDKVEKGVKEKGLLRGVITGANLVLVDAQAGVVVKTGLLKRSLGARVVAYPSGVHVAVIGPQRGHKATVTREGKTVLSDPVNYAHLVERGTVRSRAYPFLAPAYKKNARRVEAAIAAAVALVLRSVR